MTKVRVAGVAKGLNPGHSHRVVTMIRNRVFLGRLREGGPPCSAVELLARIEKQSVAAHAGILARLEEFAHSRTERALGSVLARDVKLLFGQLLAPFVVRLPDFTVGLGISIGGEFKNIGPG